jgi:uncharacterized phage protein (TIGR01671 family)
VNRFDLKFKVLAPIYKQKERRYFENKNPGDLVWFYSDIHDLLINSDKEILIYCKCKNDYFPLKDVKAICFWTTQEDRNGKDIYESDIVKLDFVELTHEGGCRRVQLIGIIEWIQCCFTVRWVRKVVPSRETSPVDILYYKSDPSYCFKDLEVIGNLHTTPDLLGTKFSMA